MPGCSRGLAFQRIILIDGRSGSGKSTLAGELAKRLPHTQLLRLDDLYWGWDGLAAAGAALPRLLRTLRWQSWNWERSQPGQWRSLRPGGTLIVEGAGALTRQLAACANLAIWTELPERERYRRAIARDGEGYAPYWSRWAAQEARHIAQHRPTQLADLVLSGSPNDVRTVLRCLGVSNGA